MTKYMLDCPELLVHFHEQIRFIELSGKAFDEGFEGEAKRLGTAIRVLVHDTRNSTSLLRQLGVMPGLIMINTARAVNPDNLAPHSGLVVMRIDSPQYP